MSTLLSFLSVFSIACYFSTLNCRKCKKYSSFLFQSKKQLTPFRLHNRTTYTIKLSNYVGALLTNKMGVDLLWHWEFPQRKDTIVYLSFGANLYVTERLLSPWWGHKSLSLRTVATSTDMSVIRSYLLNVVTGNTSESKDMSECLSCCV